MTVDPTNITGCIEALVASVAARCPIALDDYTIGPHERADKREEGELMILDWSKVGGATVDTSEPEVWFVRKVTPLRALGAAMIAVERFAHSCADLNPWPELASAADHLQHEVDGGPADRALRFGLAARAVATTLIGQRGNSRAGLDHRGYERDEPESAHRPEAVRPIGAWEFDVLSAVALCRPGALAP